MAVGHVLNRQASSIQRDDYRDVCHRYPGRHLFDGNHGIEAIETRFTGTPINCNGAIAVATPGKWAAKTVAAIITFIPQYFADRANFSTTPSVLWAERAFISNGISNSSKTFVVASILPRSDELPIIMLTLGVILQNNFKVCKLFCFFVFPMAKIQLFRLFHRAFYTLILKMMKKIKLLDKEFQLYIPYEKIKSVIEKMAQEINKDLEERGPLFVCVLNGAFMFAADLFKRIEIPEVEITFVKMASYHGIHSSGTIRQLIGLSEAIEGRTVVVIEDIVDSGNTIEEILAQLAILKPREVKIATLLSKPEAMVKKVKLDYVGLEIPNDFIVGYGLDYDGQGRNLIDIYSIVQ